LPKYPPPFTIELEVTLIPTLATTVLVILPKKIDVTSLVQVNAASVKLVQVAEVVVQSVHSADP
jgi:hypothetical protein